jgi:hypothetical protein
MAGTNAVKSKAAVRIAVASRIDDGSAGVTQSPLTYAE